MEATEKIENKAPFPVSDKGQRDVGELYGALKKSKAKLVGADGESKPLPDSVHAFLVALIAALQQGECVQILQGQACLTTAQAANTIGVSRQFLVNLLEAGEIPYHKVGTHRRIYVHDLMKYKAKRDSRRSKILRDLVAAEVRDDLYEKVAPLADK